MYLILEHENTATKSMYELKCTLMSVRGRNFSQTSTQDVWCWKQVFISLETCRRSYCVILGNFGLS